MHITHESFQSAGAPRNKYAKHYLRVYLDKVHRRNLKQGATANWHFSILVMHNLTCLSSLSFPFNQASINTELLRQQETAREKTNTVPAHTGCCVTSFIQSSCWFCRPKWATGTAASLQNKYTTLHIDPGVNSTRCTNIKCGGTDSNQYLEYRTSFLGSGCHKGARTAQ